MKLWAEIKVPGTASLDTLDEVLARLREDASVAYDLRTIKLYIDTADLPASGLPPLAEMVVRDHFRDGEQQEVIGVVAEARSLTDYHRETCEFLKERGFSGDLLLEPVAQGRAAEAMDTGGGS